MTFTRTARRTEETLLRHMEAFAEGDLDVLMSDYCQDAVLITAEGVFRGSGEIRRFFEKVPGPLAARGSTFEISWRIVERTIAYIVWSERSGQSDIPFAADTLIIRDGKIVAQTFTTWTDQR